jgi:hypothetical protein
MLKVVHIKKQKPVDEEVRELAAILRAKWERRDKEKAAKKLKEIFKSNGNKVHDGRGAKDLAGNSERAEWRKVEVY